MSRAGESRRMAIVCRGEERREDLPMLNDTPLTKWFYDWLSVTYPFVSAGHTRPVKP